MTSLSQQRLQQITEHLTPSSPASSAPGALPEIKKIASDSTGQRVKGKVIIVTGANSPLGIGRAAAHQFAHHGARAIYLCDYLSTHLAAHQAECQSLYPDVDIHTRCFDAADEAAVKAVVDDAVRDYGRLDIFFANAGIVGSGRVFTAVTSEEMMQTLRTNVLSVFLAAKHAAPAMRLTSSIKLHSGGSIVATASVAGLRSNAGGTDYSASKAAIVSLVQTMAWQLAGTDVRCNAICPGLVETGMMAPMYDAARARGTAQRVGQLNPSRRGAHADEVARVALFLGSDEASYVNGQAWAVCGGLSAGLPVVPGKLG